MKNNFQKFAKITSKVLFFKKGKSIYFLFNNKEYEYNNITINKFKKKLTLPYKISFYGLSKAQFSKILSTLLNNTTDVIYQKIDNKKDNILKFEAIFFQIKKPIDVYKMTNISYLYGRRNNYNPYILTNINGKNTLIEVTKDYIKANVGEYYFLASDLIKEEKELFNYYYTKIECDHIYRLDNNREFIEEKIKTKSLRK